MTTTATTPVSTLAAQAGVWTIDPAHSRVGFSAKHAMVTTVRGSFHGVSGQIKVVDETTAEVTATIDASTIDTGQEKRDGHLRSADFLDVENHPELTFTSTGVEDVDGDELVLVGDLTILGVTKPVRLDVEFNGIQTDHANNVRAGFEASTKISRKDWGLTWNAALEAGGVLISDAVKITLDISAVKQA